MSSLAYQILADLVVVTHFAFAVFAGVGGLLIFKWKRCAWFQVPAFLWAAMIEFADWMCPLTFLEDWLRLRAGGEGYSGDFIEHYLMPVLYPDELTRTFQITVGLLVLGLNVGVYSWFLWKAWKRSHGNAVSIHRK